MAGEFGIHLLLLQNAWTLRLISKFNAGDSAILRHETDFARI
jgi:hypothetical protein